MLMVVYSRRVKLKNKSDWWIVVETRESSLDVISLDGKLCYSRIPFEDVEDVQDLRLMCGGLTFDPFKNPLQA